MSGTTNLGLPYVAAAQNQKEVTLNSALDKADKALTETFSADLASGNVTLTTTQYRECLMVLATNATTGGRTVTLPQVERIALLRAETSCTQPVGFVRGSTTLTAMPGQTLVVRTDGTANGLVALVSSSAAGMPGEFWLALSDEGTVIEAGNGKVSFRAPYALGVTEVRASLRGGCAAGTFTIDINVSAASILSTKLTIDAGETTSATAAVPPVLSTTTIDDDEVVTIDVDDAGDETATGLKILIRGIRL